jgi:hypothetical protein
LKVQHATIVRVAINNAVAATSLRRLQLTTIQQSARNAAATDAPQLRVAHRGDRL